ncbi:hypothetical protein [Citrobacter freundii]|uniref:hypothetical protein n=1 Tax=Citrobacter freundii TaxID=546 RepID=UPI0023B2EB66|nr:hypothetical protein [Citrobacter freundii]MDE9642053.1 hypothetical protein [Citrobacter freundii]
MTKDERAQIVTAQRYLKSAVEYLSCGRVTEGVACVDNVDLLIDALMKLKERKDVLKGAKSKK